ncbi:MAG: NAD(P)H-dependent oxidoreductase [Bacteroidales bacterium]|nr:NAD(P)H-dependent oxidoreductase [Bacteroidales bacterium]
MKVSIITGSHRSNSQSAKVGSYLQKQISELKLFKETYLLNLAHADIPFWDEDLKETGDKWKDTWKPVENELRTSDAFIIVTPEWNGMVPSKLKNLFLLPKADVMGHKPALIVAISAGMGGSYPVSELRSSGYKNTRICYIPEHIIIRNVEQVLNEQPDENNKNDIYIRQRIDYVLTMLSKYAEAFIHLRNADFDLFKYPNGM